MSNRNLKGNLKLLIDPTMLLKTKDDFFKATILLKNKTVSRLVAIREFAAVTRRMAPFPCQEEKSLEVQTHDARYNE